MKKIISIAGLVALSFFMTGLLTAAAPLPVTTFTLDSDIPESPEIITKNVGETFTVRVQVVSDVQFSSVHANPSFRYPGKGVVAIQGGDRAGSGTTATLEITYKAKSNTSRMEGGFAPVHFVIGVRYGSGYVAVHDYVFNVIVP